MLQGSKVSKAPDVKKKDDRGGRRRGERFPESNRKWILETLSLRERSLFLSFCRWQFFAGQGKDLKGDSSGYTSSPRSEEKRTRA